MAQSPLSLVKERFGKDRKAAKQKLVEAVRKLAGEDLWLEHLNDAKGFDSVSNAKLLRLEKLFGDIKKAVGSRDKLVGKIAELAGRAKDADYKKKLSSLSTSRLWDQYQSLSRSTKN